LLFRKKFGRDPRPDDPIFLDPDADEPRPVEEAKVGTATAQAMKDAGMDPAKIYAFQRTGMLVTGDNLEKWSSEDLDEWNATIQEFEARRWAKEV
jgi:hypothetical protein